MAGAIARLRYMLATRRIEAMGADDRRRAGLATYECVYDALGRTPGDRIGTCVVTLSCDYAAHVRCHCESVLAARLADDGDALSWYDVSDDGDGHWTVSVRVSTSHDRPAAVADACAMSAILRIPTATGDYRRNYGEVTGAEGLALA